MGSGGPIVDDVGSRAALRSALLRAILAVRRLHPHSQVFIPLCSLFPVSQLPPTRRSWTWSYPIRGWLSRRSSSRGSWQYLYCLTLRTTDPCSAGKGGVHH